MVNTKTDAVANLALESSLTAAVAAAELAGQERVIDQLLAIKTAVVARRQQREANYVAWLASLDTEGPNQPGDATA